MPRFLIQLVLFGFGVLTVSDLHAGLTPHVQWNKDTLPLFMPGVDSIRFMEDVVITGTRTARRSAESPVMVTVMENLVRIVKELVMKVEKILLVNHLMVLMVKIHQKMVIH